MKFIVVLCIVSSLFVGLSVPAHAIDREAFTFTKYNLDIRIEPEQQRLAVRGKIVLRNDSTSPQKSLSLQISSSLNWRSIQVEGKPVQFVSQPYTSDIDHTGALSEALVTLPQGILPKATVDLEVGYEGVIALDATRLTRIGVPAGVAQHSDWDQIGKSSSAVRGIGYVTWYPVATEAANLSEGNSVFETVARWTEREKASEMQLEISQLGEGPFPSFLCNGKDGQHSDEKVGGAPGSMTECGFSPLGLTVPLLMIGNYATLDQPPMKISYFQDHKAAAASYALAAQTTLPFVTDWFGGSREASGRADVAELSDPEAAPYESASMLLTSLNIDSKMAQFTAVHQLTHAAFVSARPWIYEGLAHFAQAVYRERESGRDSALDFMGLHRTAVSDAEKAISDARRQNDSADDSLINTNVEEFYRSKAMYVWWMLRDMIGDAALKQGLSSYRADADNTSAYMQRLIESSAKRDLQWFFDDWVYHDRGLPDFKVASVYPRKMAGNIYIVTLTLQNSGTAGAEVPVVLKMVDGEINKRLEVRAKSEITVRIEARSTPLELVVNDGSVPESDTTDNVHKIEIPQKAN
jgi:hypothetical protein